MEDKNKTNTGIATVIFKKDNIVLLVNREFEKLTGYTGNEVEGKKKWTEFIFRIGEGEFKERNNYFIYELSAPRTYELQLVNQNGQIKDTIASVIPGMRQTLITLRDITELKRSD